MTKFASQLPDDYEYALVAWGQSNFTPNGSQSKGNAEDPDLVLLLSGVTVTASGAGTGESSVTLSASLTQSFIGAEFRLGTNTTPAVGYGTITGWDPLTPAVITVNWTIAAGSFSSALAYIVYRDGRHRKFDNVRMLQPFLPDEGGDPATAGANGQTLTVTDPDDLGVFVEFSFFEGVAGYGFTEESKAFDSATPTTFVVVDTAPLDTNIMAGSYLKVEHDNGTSYAEVATHTDDSDLSTFTLTAAGWFGDGTPTGTVTYQIWLPYFTSSPHEWEPGPGFLYPTNHSQPISSTTLNRPQGITSAKWNTLFGSILPFAVRVADELGKRVNIIYLTVDATGLRQERQLFGGGTVANQLGWYDDVRLDWNPATTNGLAARLKKMITVMAPAALTAEGSTKTLRVLGVAGMQGETEAISTAGRTQYRRLLPMFYQWLQKTVFDAGLSYYDAVDDLPIVHAGIHKTVWETTAGTNNPDTDGLVNRAITDFTAKARLAATIDVNDSSISTTTGHYEAAGEVRNGKLLAEALVPLIADAVSSREDLDDPIAIDICNTALSYIGDSGGVTSLDPSTDASEQAAACKELFPKARNILLERCTWSFATRRAPLGSLSDDVRKVEWLYAYGMPDNCVKVFAVLPEGAADDYSIGLDNLRPDKNADGDILPRIGYGLAYTPMPFSVQQDIDGYPILYTNVENATARYNVVITDASRFSDLFRNACSWQLASMLANRLMQGQEGAAMTQRALQIAEAYLSQAKDLDGGQRDIKPAHTPDWIKAR